MVTIAQIFRVVLKTDDRRKTNTKVITPTNHNASKQRCEPIRILATGCNLLQGRGREKSRVQDAIASGSYWLKKWRGIFSVNH